MVGIKDSEMSTCCTNSSFEHCQFYDICRHRETIRANYKPNDCPLVEAIPKSDYETRLKADLVAMLENLDLQIDESASYNLEVAKVQRLIRDKINVLRGEKDETDKSNK